MPTGGAGGRMGFPGGPVQSAANKAQLRDMLKLTKYKFAGERLENSPQMSAPNTPGMFHEDGEYRRPISPTRDLRLT